MTEQIKLRLETKSDYKKTEIMLRNAFWNEFQPGCVEHYLMNKIRNHPRFVSKLDTVAVAGDEIVGCAAFLEDKIQGDDGKTHSILCLGPLAVAPEYQQNGLGGRLIEHSKKLALELGYNGIILYGDPNYYSRKGFESAKNYNIRMANDKFATVLQVVPLYQDALKDCAGRYVEDEVYGVNQAEVDAFDAQFPFKKKVTNNASQLHFQKLIESQDVELG